MIRRRIPGKKTPIISNPSSIAEIRDPKRLHPNRRPGNFFSISNPEKLRINFRTIFDGSKFFPSSKTYRPKKR